MSIATEITRLQGAKANLKTAIEGKGVTVSSSALLDDYPDLVDAIQTGGGGYSIDDICDDNVPSGDIVIGNATRIGAYAFAGRKGITSVSSDSVTEINARGFTDCSELLEVSLPNLVYMSNTLHTSASPVGYYFSGCTKLRRFYAPKLRYIYGNHAFSQSAYVDGCGTNDLVFVLPALEAMGTTCFSYCYALLYDFGENLTKIESDAFYGRSANFQRNRTVILRKTSVVPAHNTDSIREITDVYCPNSLISTYQSATHWSTRYTGGYIAFHAIEGSIYETHYADGTLIPTS